MKSTLTFLQIFLLATGLIGCGGNAKTVTGNATGGNANFSMENCVAVNAEAECNRAAKAAGAEG
jgi:ribosome-associated protein YbcJ (S4-like RNA binding protein)